MEEEQLIKKQVVWEPMLDFSRATDPKPVTALLHLYHMLVELFVNRKADSMSLISKDSLLQIWLPIGSYISAWKSPYGIAYEKGSSQLLLYRKESSRFRIRKDCTTLCSPFSDQANYLQYHTAKRFGIQSSKLFPVLNFSSPIPSSIIAVLELVTTKKDPDFAIEEYREIKRELEKVGFKTSYLFRKYSVEETGLSLGAQGGLLGYQYMMERSILKSKQVGREYVPSADHVSEASSTNYNTNLPQKTHTIDAAIANSNSECKKRKGWQRS